MTLQISQDNSSFLFLKLSHTEKASTDLPVSLWSRVTTHITFTFNKERSTLGALAVPLKILLGAIRSATGRWQETDLSYLTSLKAATTESANANTLRMLLSATELTDRCSNTTILHIEVSMNSGAKSDSTSHGDTFSITSTRKREGFMFSTLSGSKLVRVCSDSLCVMAMPIHYSLENNWLNDTWLGIAFHKRYTRDTKSKMRISSFI